MKRIIYDISAILKGIGSKTDRGGIYFSAYNILREMVLRDDIKLAFYNSTPQWCYYEKTLQEMLGTSDICLINCSERLMKFSKLWIALYEKKIFYHERGKKYKEFMYRLYGLVIRKMTEIEGKIIEMRGGGMESFDFYFSPMLQAPDYILDNSKITKVIVIHDTIPFIYPDYYPEMNWRRKYWIKHLVESMNNEELFLANSQNTKKDFLDLKKEIMPQRIRVVYHACSEHFVPCCDEKILSIIKHKYNIPQDKKYVFCLCTIEPRKNLIRIVKTFVEFINKNQIDDLILVLGGGYWEKFMSDFNNNVEKIQDFSDIVHRVGYIDDEDLPHLYSGSLFFVYTSQYEGFGVPVLEAMKCGCPVIASNNSSIPEIVADAGIVIEWNNDEKHIQAFEKYYYDEAYRLQQAQKGLLRAAMFSWKKAVDDMLNEMESDRNV